MGSSQTRAQTRVPCIGRQILNHCATREAQELAFDVGKRQIDWEHRGVEGQQKTESEVSVWGGARGRAEKRTSGKGLIWVPSTCVGLEVKSSMSWSGLLDTQDYPHPEPSYQWGHDYLLQMPSLASENNV